MLTTEKIAKSFGVGAHGSTYGGNALGCAVALAVLDVIVDPATPANVAARTAQLRAGLKRLNERYALFSDIRSSGLWFGCELIPAWHGRAKEFVKLAEKHGLMMLVAGTNVIRLAPSLLITEADVVLGLERFERVLEEITAPAVTTTAAASITAKVA